MGLLGSTWGTAEELLHPRDRNGRFARKLAMSESTGKKILGFLDRFNPRTFQSDGQASQFLFNKAKPGRFPGDDIKRLHMDWDEANDHIRAGDIDPSTQRFIDMMEQAQVQMPDQMIVTRTVGPEAFGITPEQLAADPQALRELIQGKLFADRGYSTTVIGTPQGKGPGRIAITIATPHGQPVIIPGRTPGDRAVMLPRGQRIRVTKVKPDGTGGYTVMAVAEPEGVAPGDVPEPMMPGRRGAGLSEAQREDRITPSMSPEQRQQIAQQNEREMQTGPNAPTPAGDTQPAPVSAPPPVQGPTSPATGVPERQEPTLKDAVGPTAREGTSPAEIAQEGEAAKQAAEATPATPAPATPESFRVALATTDLKSPSRGKRQKEFDDAQVGIVSGKQHPQDALRQLDTDIEVNKRQLERQKAGTEKLDPELEQDIKDQEALADLISSHHGIPRRGQEARGEAQATPSAPTATKAATPRASKKAAGAKATPAKKAGPTPTPGAPSTTKEATPKAPEPAPDRRTKAELLKEAGDAGRARMTKAQLLQAIEHKKTREATPAPVSEAKAPGSKFTPAQEKRLLDRADTFRGKEANDEERRIVGEADKILARRGIEKRISGKETRSEMRERTKGPGLSDEQKAAIQAKAARADERVRAEQDEDETGNKADLAPLLESAGLQEDDLDDLDKTGAAVILSQVRNKKISKAEGVRRLKASKSDRLKALGNALDAQPRKVAPAKAVAKKAVPAKAEPSPMDDAEEAFKARVTEAGLPDKVADLRAQAREKKIRGFSTMNKRQLQSALLGDEVPKASKIAKAAPAKMVPHLQAAESDQAARKLLESHTLVDLKDLAKHLEIKPPSRGATKEKLKDLILADVRGQEAGTGGRMPEQSLMQELESQGWVKPEFRDVQDRVDAEIRGTDQADPDSLREHRDNLEAYAKEVRASGNRQDANLIQTLADTMGMRAQTISGVEEPAVRAPAKKAAKVAVPEVAGPEAPKTLDKMLRPELAQVALDEGVDVKKSATKAQLREAIERDRRVKAARAEGAPNLGGQRDRAPTPEEIARDAVPETAPPVKKATKKAAKKAVDQATEALAPQLKGTFGDQIQATDPDEMRTSVRAVGLEPKGNTSEEMFDNALKDMLENRMRELGMLPEDPAKPTRAQKRVPKGSVPGRAITTPDRKESFREAWDAQKLQATGTSARSLDEVRDDIESGKITPEEGVRRLDSDILFNEDEINDIQAELEGMEPDDRENSDLSLRGAQLEENVRAQKKAKTFIREHFEDEAPVTRQELEIQLDGPEKAALDRVDVDSLKEAARQEGLGDIEGDDKDTVIQNIARAVAARELADRAKKAAPAKKAPAIRAGRGSTSTPVKKAAKAAVPAKAIPPPVVDLDQPTRHHAELIGTGLDLDAKGEDKLWLDVVQRDLDNGVDGRQIADGLRRGADSERTLHNIETQSGGTDPDTGRAGRINRMELMADRLEGVRPIKKAAPAAPAKTADAPAKREMDTMQAATAQSKALFDLRNGKSHAEVATALRQAATGVNSREHDPQTVRPLSFTPSERSAMKRSDAKRLRELAAEIQAQGVAQRTEARAAKKATSPAGKKAAKAQGEFVERMARERAAFEGLGDKPPKKRTAAEMRRARNAAEAEGVPVEQVLERWDQQKQDRKNLTGPVGELIAAQIEDAHQALLAADTPARESEATGRLLHPELRTWAEKLGLSPSGTKAVLEKRIADRIKGREAPTTSATRALPDGGPVRSSATSITDSGGRIRAIDRARADEPIYLPNRGNDQGMIHLDGALGSLWADLYTDQREPNSFINELAKMGDEFGVGNLELEKDVLPKLKDLKARASDKGVADRIQQAIDALDAPPVAMPDLPEGTPPAVRRYLEELRKIPTARKTGRVGAQNLQTSVFDQQVQLIRDIADGKIRPVEGAKALQKRHLHESADGAFKMWGLAETIFLEKSPKFDQNGTLISGNPDWPEIYAWLRAARNKQ